MQPAQILRIIKEKFNGLEINTNWGETGLFYNPEGKLKKGIYLLTIKEKDGANDKASNLNREGVFRLNLGVSKTTFIELFGEIPTRPPAGGIINMDYDFTKQNTLMPHPVYGWMSWLCVLNPGADTFEGMLPLIEEGYDLALKKYAAKKLN